MRLTQLEKAEPIDSTFILLEIQETKIYFANLELFPFYRTICIFISGEHNLPTFQPMNSIR